MSVRALYLVLAAVLSVLVVAAVARAANSSAFSDPSGDAGTAPDITGVSVTSDDAGTITFNVKLANRATTLHSADGVFVNLDLDQNPDTGSAWYGTEVGLGLEGTSLAFLRPDNNKRGMTPATPPQSFHGSFNNGVATFAVKASDLGLSPAGGFNVWAHTENNLFNEEAPNIRTVNYQLVPGTASPALGPDTRGPYDQAFSARGQRGHVLHLDYDASDGRGRTADVIRVYNKGRVIKRFAFQLADTDPLGVYYAKWRAPKKIRGSYKFCVVSADAAGNKSNTACAKISIR